MLRCLEVLSNKLKSMILCGVLIAFPFCAFAEDIEALLSEIGLGAPYSLVSLSAEDTLRILYRLAEEGDAAKLAKALDAGLDPNAKVNGAAPALHVAVSLGDEAIVVALLDAGADPEAKHDGANAAEHAALTGHPSLLRLFDVPLEAALFSDFVAQVQRDNTMLLASVLSSPDFDANRMGPDGTTPLIQAIILGSPDAVRLVLSAGADPRAAALDGMTPIIAAVMANNEDALRQLLDMRVTPPERFQSLPLVSLSVIAGGETVPLLLSAGLSADIRDDDGVSAVDLAIATGQADVVAVLEQRGGQTSLPSGASVNLAAALANGDVDTLDSAAKDGADFDQVNQAGTPLLVQAAATAKDARTFSVVLSNVDVLFTRDAQRNSVVDGILSRGGPQSAREEFFLALTTEADRRGLNLEPLFNQQLANRPSVAAQLAEMDPPTKIQGYANAVRLAAASVHTSDSSGHTPMQIAVTRGNLAFVRALRLSDAILQPPKMQPTLQDLARSEKQWAIFNVMPTDRSIPKDFEDGPSADAKQALQSLLKQLRYYEGAIDGKFGPMTRSAVKRLARDQIADMMAMKNARALVAKQAKGGGTAHLELQSINLWCRWIYVQWKSGDEYLGCVRGGKFPGRGLGVYFPKGNAADIYWLNGSSGWENQTKL